MPSFNPMMQATTMTASLSRNVNAATAVVEADFSLPGHAAAVLAMMDVNAPRGLAFYMLDPSLLRGLSF